MKLVTSHLSLESRLFSVIAALVVANASTYVRSVRIDDDDDDNVVALYLGQNEPKLRSVHEHYGHRSPSPVKYASGSRMRASCPKLWPRNIISPPHGPRAPSLAGPVAPRMPASSYAGYLASIALYYEGYGHPRGSLIFRCIFNQA